jgi:CheY-like chemotaxis protein
LNAKQSPSIGLQILVVEDDAEIRSLVSDVFEGAGYQVLLAENGAVALEQVREICPALIMLDLLMPVLDGWEFLEVASREGLCSTSQIVLMSAYFGGVAGTEEDMKPHGVVGLLPKPFELNELLAIAARYTSH